MSNKKMNSKDTPQPTAAVPQDQDDVRGHAGFLAGVLVGGAAALGGGAIGYAVSENYPRPLFNPQQLYELGQMSGKSEGKTGSE